MSSTEKSAVGVVAGAPDGQQALQQEIERTRENLGQTVEALVAKVDVRARAQDEAGRLIGRLKARAVQARTQAAARAAQARQQAGDKAAGSRQRAAAQGRHVRRQVAEQAAGPLSQAASIRDAVAEQVGPQAAAAAAGISKVTPDPVKRAVGDAADTTRRRRGPLAAGIGAVVAALLGWLLVKRWRQRR